jgi:hypothetical protein
MSGNILPSVVGSGDTLTQNYFHSLIDGTDVKGIGSGAWAGGDYRLIQPEGATLPTEPALFARSNSVSPELAIWSDTGPTWSRLGPNLIGPVQVKQNLKRMIPQGGPFFISDVSQDLSDGNVGTGSNDYFPVKFLPEVGNQWGGWPDGHGGPYVNLEATCETGNPSAWRHQTMQTYGWCDVYVKCSGATAAPGDPIILSGTNDYFWAVPMSCSSFGASGGMSGVLCGHLADYALDGHDGLARCFFTGAKIWRVIDDAEHP